MKSRNNTIDAIKGGLIFLMVLGHLIQFTSLENEYLNDSIFIFIYSFHMPLFMLISGFFFGKSILAYSPISLLKSKSKSILLPYFFWTFLFVISWSVLQAKDYDIIHFMDKVFSTLLYVNKLWFLWTLYICMILFYISHFLEKWFSFFSFIFIFIILLMLPNTQLIGITDIKYMYIYFVLGVIYQKYKNVYKFNIYINYFTLFSLFLYPILINNWKVDYFSFFIDFDNIKPIIFKYITAFSGILLIVGVLKNYYSKINFNYFERLGKYSIAIYILSDYFVEVINHFNSIFVYFNPFYKIPILILFSILICELSLLIIKITSRNSKLSMILWGNR